MHRWQAEKRQTRKLAGVDASQLRTKHTQNEKFSIFNVENLFFVVRIRSVHSFGIFSSSGGGDVGAAASVLLPN